MGLTRQEYSGNLPNPGIKPRSPTLQADSLPTELWGKPSFWGSYHFIWVALALNWASMVAQTVNCLLTRETWVQSLGEEDSLGKEMATHSSTLAWKIHCPFKILVTPISYLKVTPKELRKPRLWHVKYLLISHSVQLLSRVRLFVTPWTTALQASLSITNSWSLPKLMSIESVMPSHHLILCCPLLLLPSIFPSIRVFSNESVLHIRWPKYWSFSFSISPSKQFLVTKISLELRLSRTRSLIPAVLGPWQLLPTSWVFSRFIVCSHRCVGDVMWLHEGDNINVCCFMQWSPLLIILCAPENT